MITGCTILFGKTQGGSPSNPTYKLCLGVKMDVIVSRNLSLIGSLKPGDTISKLGDNLVVTQHDAWMTRLIRVYTGDTKDKTLLYINTIIGMAMLKDIPIPECVYTGLKNLKITYTGWPDFCSKIDITLNKMIRSQRPQIQVSQSEIIEIVKDRVKRRMEMGYGTPHNMSPIDIIPTIPIDAYADITRQDFMGDTQIGQNRELVHEIENLIDIQMDGVDQGNQPDREMVSSPVGSLTLQDSNRPKIVKQENPGLQTFMEFVLRPDITDQRNRRYR